MPEKKVFLTMLNQMAGGDIRSACEKMRLCGIRHLDLKDGIFGKQVENLDEEDASAMAQLALEFDMKIHTLSSCIFWGDIERGESFFRESYMKQVDNITAAARIIRPEVVRLLAAQSSRRAGIANSAQAVSRDHPWLPVLYREAIDRITETGAGVVIENEVHQCIFSEPGEILDFFALLDRPGKVQLTWDIQNLWQMGAFPSVEIYRRLRPIIGMIHLKGGRSELPGGPLKYQSYLEDTSWPVNEILREVIRDGVSPVICLNPSHGAASPDYKPDVRREIKFLRDNFPEVE